MVDFRDFLSLEAMLHQRLLRDWRALAAPLFVQIDREVKAGRFDRAYEIANTIDLTEVATKNKGFIRGMLLTFAMFGASQVNSGKHLFLSVGAAGADDVLDSVMSVFMRSIEWNATLHAIRSATATISAAERDANELAQKADDTEAAAKAGKLRYTKEFVTFRKDGDEMLQLIASLHASRLSTWGFAAEAELLDVTYYKVNAVLDGRTSPFCRWIHGRVFEVERARTAINTILKVQEPDDLKTIQPWPRVSKAAMEEYAKLSDEEIVARNWHIPPYHPGCRTLLLAADAPTPRLEVPAPQEAEIAPGPDPIPPAQVEPESFTDLGVKPTPKQVDDWNALIGVHPLDLLTKVSGKTPAQILDEVRSKKMLTLLKDGDVKLRFDSPVGKGKFSGGFTYNPYNGVLQQSYGQYVGVSKKSAFEHFVMTQQAVVDAAASVRAAEVQVMVAQGQQKAMAHLGFLPAADDWQAIRLSLLDDIAVGGDLHKAFGKLPAKEQAIITALLNSKKERAFWALADLKLSTTFLKSLFDFMGPFVGYLRLSDAAALEKLYS